jgi:hypothetical protein
MNIFSLIPAFAALAAMSAIFWAASPAVFFIAWGIIFSAAGLSIWRAAKTKPPRPDFQG